MTTSSLVTGHALFHGSAGDGSSHGSGGDSPSLVSTSTIVAGDVSGSHLHMTVVDYSRTKLVPNGKLIESSPFLLGGCTWRLRYYPRGATPALIEYASLFIKIDDTLAEDEAMGVRVRLSLLDQVGNPVPSGTHTSICYGFSNDSRSFGFSKFIRITELEKHLKDDDSFTIQVDVTIDNGIYVLRSSIEVPPSDMCKRFGDLLLTKEGADVEFRVGGETFLAHQTMLVARSPVFKAQLLSAMKEGRTTTTKQVISIGDMEAEVFDALLTYIYTDALPDSMDQQNEPAMAQQLLVAAYRYGLERLMRICEIKLCGLINTSSVATILAFAEQHHCHGLKTECMLFLDNYGRGHGVSNLRASCPGITTDILL